MEILKRKTKTEREQPKETQTKMQVSYNNFGHLAIRFFSEEEKDEDTLIVFTSAETRSILRFCQQLKNYY